MKPGSIVKFVDQPHNVLWESDQPAMCTGHVNGKVMELDGVTYVPVWCERDHGRESTTILVHTENILYVEPGSA